MPESFLQGYFEIKEEALTHSIDLDSEANEQKMSEIMPTYTEFDSSLSLAMLEEVLKNKQIKLVLTEIATRLQGEVLSALIAQEQAGLAPKLGSLAMQHSMGDEFVGALLPDCSAEYLERTVEGRALLLTTIDKCLRDANNISTQHDFIALMKAIHICLELLPKRKLNHFQGPHYLIQF